jgi:hypothetical protein
MIFFLNLGEIEKEYDSKYVICDNCEDKAELKYVFA